MTTVVNQPASDSGNGMGLIVGVILVLVLALLFFVYGLPLLRQSTTAPQINVPDKINVNVNPGGQGQPGQ